MTVSPVYECDDTEHEGENGNFDAKEVSEIEIRYPGAEGEQAPFAVPDRRVLHVCDECADRRRVSEASVGNIEYVAVDRDMDEVIGIYEVRGSRGGPEWMEKDDVLQTPYDEWVFELVEDVIVDKFLGRPMVE